MNIELYIQGYQLFSSDGGHDSSVECPRYVIGFLLPIVYTGKLQHGMFADEYRELGLDFPTDLVYRWDEYYKRLKATVLGFGVFLSKQTGY